ncbi:hypothetical protein EPR50_G00088720 [Perca flavescens]|uniref:Uncharacterized protein n=1 Tax=Perca flavescens TaxID=8167 RepID=A0A484D2V2_PERFV|nr:hypothetical protein EPR50_G00088720 [Perca flavescens]
MSSVIITSSLGGSSLSSWNMRCSGSQCFSGNSTCGMNYSYLQLMFSLQHEHLIPVQSPVTLVKCFMFRVPYLETNDKLSFFIRIPVNWHALILNTSDVTVLDYLTC